MQSLPWGFIKGNSLGHQSQEIKWSEVEEYLIIGGGSYLSAKVQPIALSSCNEKTRKGLSVSIISIVLVPKGPGGALLYRTL